VDCSRMARSLAALVKGYREFDPRVNVVGVILNRVGSDRHLQLLSDSLAAIGIPIFGVFRREKDIQLPSRHLGLVPTGEVDGFGAIADRLADIGERCFNWGLLEPILESPSNRSKVMQRKSASYVLEEKERSVRIAIARDAAFNFYYPDNLEMLEAQGAELIYWSPLTDAQMPAADGLYFGGGFPEVFAEELAANKQVREGVRGAIANGMPTYAECGGLMYLSETLIDFDGKAWPMVGTLPQTVKMGKKLSLGYRKASAIAEGPMVDISQTVVGHEFHKSSIVETLRQPLFETRRYWGEAGNPQKEGYALSNLHASYLHLHWGHRPKLAQHFVSRCRAYAERLD
ncbi:MAG: cobyrinate a,c-diamide synthase, partial [Cyanobacteria bacterium J06649_4]